MEQILAFIGNHVILVSVLALLLMALIFTENRKSGQALSAQQAIMLLNRDEGILVDIREAREFREGHIREAINLPYANLADRSSELESYRERTLILADKAGQHSGPAGHILRKAGFPSVARLSGGIAEWQAGGLPLKK